MVDPVKKHVDELLKLPPHERSEAAELLLRSLEQEPEEDEVVVAAAWAAEIERRIGENEPGIPAETVFAEGRARLQKRS
ncbi:MAG TPA: addiction module protein [Kofleriaceae bacterium]|nr:addiction module protein [Kofleriaceae bacterium]